GDRDLRVLSFVKPGLIEHFEERPMCGGEAHVASCHRSEPVCGRPDVVYRGLYLGEQALPCADSDSSQEIVAVGKVCVRGACRHPETRAGFCDGEATDAALGDEFHGGLDQRSSQISVVISAALARAWHGPRVGSAAGIAND